MCVKRNCFHFMPSAVVVELEQTGRSVARSYREATNAFEDRSDVVAICVPVRRYLFTGLYARRFPGHFRVVRGEVLFDRIRLP